MEKDNEKKFSQFDMAEAMIKDRLRKLGVDV